MQKPILPDQDQRDRALRDLDKCFMVEAAAGTGKTTLMSGRMVNLLDADKCRPETLAAVTFTRKAAAELKLRFFSMVEERLAGKNASKYLRQYAGRINSVFIGTIHSFCAGLLRERPVEAGIDPSFREIEPDEDVELRKGVFRHRVAELVLDKDLIVDRLLRLAVEPLGLESAFIDFTNYPDVEEWPGRIEDKAVDTKILSSAIQGFIDRVETIKALLPREQDADEFGKTLWFMLRRWRQIRQRNRQEDLVTLAGFAQVLSGRKKVIQKKWADPSNSESRQFVNEEYESFEKFQEDVILPWLAELRAVRYGPIMDLFKDIKEHYEQEKSMLGVLNYQDLLMKAGLLLKERPEVRIYFQKRFTHVLVDEFQDTDPLQAGMLMLLTSQDPNQKDFFSCVPRPGSLFLVGDPKQSIYRFRRADIVTYNSVQRALVDAGGEVLYLSCNFRSASNIISWVNRVFDKVFPGEPQDYSPRNVPLSVPPGKEPGKRIFDPGVYALEIPYIPRSHGYEEKKREMEADAIASIIRDKLDSVPGASPDDFMIITFKKKSLDKYAQSLERLQVPYKVFGGRGMFELEELKMLKLLTRVALNPDDGFALALLLRSNLFGFSDLDLYEIKKSGSVFDYRVSPAPGLKSELSNRLVFVFDMLKKFSGWLEHLSPAVALENMVRELGMLGYCSLKKGSADMCIGGILRALEIVRDADRHNLAGGGALEIVEHLFEGDQDCDSITSPEEPRVSIMNLHKAKGLQAEVVFLAGLDLDRKVDPALHVDRSSERIRGYMRIEDGRTVLSHPDPDLWNRLQYEEQLFLEAEKDRLLYVAGTRARRALIISRARLKAPGSYKKTFWKCLVEDLADQPVIKKVQALGPGNEEDTREEFDSKSIIEAMGRVPDKKQGLKRKTYSVFGAKELALWSGNLAAGPDGPGTRGLDEDEHGVAWGSVIHRILEETVKNAAMSLDDAASIALKEEGLDPGLKRDAVLVVKRVRDSGLWDRLKKSRTRMAEVPLYIKGSIIGRSDVDLVRGVIDLVFEEEDGWVVVDYKTDKVRNERHLEELKDYYGPQLKLYAKALQQGFGLNVKESFLLFTSVSRGGENLVVNLGLP
ncbi:MAG: UvrD-helicase domain-containing protein [Deltaproteobacteria bacterium]|nr:UvrD-helicase domain-containing protein [Deltaproteobacteria bacterium]